MIWLQIFGYFHFLANGCLFYNFFLPTSLHLELRFLLQGSILLIGEYISYHVLFVSSKMMQCKQRTNCLFLFCRYQVLHWITWSRKSFGSLLCPEEKDNCKWISVLRFMHLIMMILSNDFVIVFCRCPTSLNLYGDGMDGMRLQSGRTTRRWQFGRYHSHVCISYACIFCIFFY